MGIIAELKREIDEQGTSRASVAERAGMIPQQLYMLLREGAALPAGRNAERLATALGCQWVLVPLDPTAPSTHTAEPDPQPA